MRITGGTLVGRTFEPPVSTATRPMMDRIRQALFNILAHRNWGTSIGDALTDAYVLDAFCGTGALAFEALSYGATHATLFDKDRQALDIATKNAAKLGLKDQCTIISTDTLAPPKAPQPCRMVFLAPPYRKGLIPPALLALDKAGWIAPHALILAETAKKEPLDVPDGFTVELTRGYADTMLHFLVR